MIADVIKFMRTQTQVMMKQIRNRWLIMLGALLGSWLSLTAAETPVEPAWVMGPFVRPASPAPVIAPNTNLIFACPMNQSSIAWAALHTFNPAAVVKDGRICVLYRAEDGSGAMKIGGHTSRIGLAKSTDGIHFTSEPAPVLFPAEDGEKTNEWTGGCEDPRIVETAGGQYVMMYTEFRRDDKHRLPRLGVATSTDLVHWTKHGPVFAQQGGSFSGRACKSGAILTQMVGEKLLAAKHLGKYWMYWGEGEIRLASSTDLINWSPGPVVLRTRTGKFDSALVEAGPPALLTSKGIILIYNGKNANTTGDAKLKPGAYAGGQALFDPAQPEKLLDRTDTPFYQPVASFEQTGQYGAGTTFLEGLVPYHGKWWLYYGCADSFVAVASSDLSPLK